MESEENLRNQLRAIDRRSYRAYGDLRGRRFALGDLQLAIDHVQGDPFAAPSRVRIEHPYGAAGLPAALRRSPEAEVAFRDWMARRMQNALRRAGGGLRRGSGGSGRIEIDAGGQEVLERSAVVCLGDGLEMRLEVGLPAAGRRILGDAAVALLAEALPTLAAASLELDDAACEEALRFSACAENYAAIRAELETRGLVAFVAEGAILPRASGVDDRPLANARPFASPPSLRVRFDLPHAPGRVEGLGIPRGVTLIVGGGYHGKSTLLHALERGVYPHIPGDGRECVVTDPMALKVRAEDGRRVEGVDIEPFVRDLPGGQPTHWFQTDDASGSTSQAASVMEALEAGARVLLMDEDSCATNFMTRDARMQALVAPDREPITPLVDRVRELYDDHGVSTVLVAGSSGDFFSAADTVVEMRAFEAIDRGNDARALAGRPDSHARAGEADTAFHLPDPRAPVPASLAAKRRGPRPARVAVRGRYGLRYGDAELELRACEQIVDSSQTRAIGRALGWLAERGASDASVAEHLDALDALLEEGIDALGPRAGEHPGNLARPRRLEVAGALNRLRTLQIRRPTRAEP